MKIKIRIIFAFFMFISFANLYSEEIIILRYAHMNSPDSVAGMQAVYFAELVNKKSNGLVKIEIYPASQLGGLQEMAVQVSNGAIAIHHNTMAGIGSLSEEFAAIDTPYLYNDVNHLLKVVDFKSPVFKRLNESLLKTKGVRILYTFYFGTRVLTCNKPVYTPNDLKGVKIRAIPFPIYEAAVEGLGAIATPIDISQLSTALSKGFVNGQENPFDTILILKFYEVQKYLILTNHILGAECVVMNDKIFQSLPEKIRTIIMESAEEAGKMGTKMTLDLEDKELKELKAKGMIVIDSNNGLKLDKFRSNTKKVVKNKIGNRFSEIYKLINSVK